MKRTAADARWSKAVRTRDGFRCVRCGKKHAENSFGLHAAHVFSRGYKGLRPGFEKHTGDGCCARHDLENGHAACYGCHRYLDQHGDEKKRFFRELLGDEAYDALWERCRTPTKRVSRPTAAPE